MPEGGGGGRTLVLIMVTLPEGGAEGRTLVLIVIITLFRKCTFEI